MNGTAKVFILFNFAKGGNRIAIYFFLRIIHQYYIDSNYYY